MAKRPPKKPVGVGVLTAKGEAEQAAQPLRIGGPLVSPDTTVQQAIAKQTTPSSAPSITITRKKGEPKSDFALRKKQAADAQAKTAGQLNPADFKRGTNSSGAQVGPDLRSTIGYSYNYDLIGRGGSTNFTPFSATAAIDDTHPVQGMPIYYQGDEWNIGRTMATEDVTHLQDFMRATGILGAKTYVVPGVFDDTTAAAFQKVLSGANGLGVDYVSFLSHEAEIVGVDGSGGAGGGGGGGGGGSVQTVALPDPAQIANEANAAALKLLGRSLNQTEIGSVTSTINDLINQKAAQQAARDPNLPPINVDLTSEAAKAVRQLNPGEAQYAGVENTFDMFASMLGKGGSFGGVGPTAGIGV